MGEGRSTGSKHVCVCVKQRCAGARQETRRGPGRGERGQATQLCELARGADRGSVESSTLCSRSPSTVFDTTFTITQRPTATRATTERRARAASAHLVVILGERAARLEPHARRPSPPVAGHVARLDARRRREVVTLAPAARTPKQRSIAVAQLDARWNARWEPPRAPRVARVVRTPSPSTSTPPARKERMLRARGSGARARTSSRRRARRPGAAARSRWAGSRRRGRRRRSARRAASSST